MRKNMNKNDSINLILMARDFWNLTSNSADDDCGDFNKQFKEHTKWSDISIAQPVLFCFYHGIELSLKALLSAKLISTPNSHRLIGLYELVNKAYSHNEINKFYEKYLLKGKLHPILETFCNESDITMDMYYQSLKYPKDSKGNDFNHSPLKYNGNKGTILFKEIKTDIDKIIELVINLIAQEFKHA